MFREMRRKRQQLSRKETEEVLRRATSGVLALLGEDGYPYAVPLSYFYEDSRLYFHCARSGHKLDAIRGCEKASFCVIGQDEVVPERYTTRYRSVIAFGRIRILEDDAEKRAVIEKLARKYHPADSEEGRNLAIEKNWSALAILEFSIEHMTGKEGLELLKERQA